MTDPRDAEPWLPDFCRLRRVGLMLGLAEVSVAIVALAPDGSSGWSPHQFALASGYALWLALAVSVLLCVTRRSLSQLPQRTGALAAVVLCAVVAGVVAAIVQSLFSIVGETGDGLLRFVGGTSTVVALITALALRYFYVFDRWEAQIGAQARAEADALQARIRPHFLFNSMNMIATLLRRDPVVAERAVLDLSDLFRAALGAGEGSGSLREEVELAERYLDIEQLRLGKRLTVEWERAEELPWTLAMPRLTLQPLLENAVLHGVSRLPEGGMVRIALSVANGFLHIEVHNPSLPPQEAGVQGAGHAQRSIGHRLGYAFGPRARMSSAWQDGHYRCILDLPLP